MLEILHDNLCPLSPTVVFLEDEFMALVSSRRDNVKSRNSVATSVSPHVCFILVLILFFVSQIMHF